MSKTLQGHFDAGVYEVGQVVEVAKTVGSPKDFHLVSLDCCMKYFFEFLHFKVKIVRKSSIQLSDSAPPVDLIPLVNNNITEG